MSGWIFDEDISHPTADKLNAHGIRGNHIKYDLKKSGLEDPEVFKLAKKHKSTLLTSDGTQFSRLSDTELQNSYGVWIVESTDPDDIVGLVKKAIDSTKLRSKTDRKNKRVNITKIKVDVYDVTKRTKLLYKFITSHK